MGKAPDGPEAVDAWLAAFDDPRRAGFAALRAAILGADPAVAEGIKWNVPSFRTTEWFATLHPRAKEGLAAVLHLGAKARAVPPEPVPDPAGLLRPLAADRAMLVLRDAAELEEKRDAVTALLRAWIARV